MMKEDAKVKNARKRKEEFEENLIDRQTEKQLKKLAREDKEDEQKRVNAKRTAEDLGTEDEEERKGRRTGVLPMNSRRGSKSDRGEIE